MTIKTAIENYLAIISSQEGDEETRIKNLILSLDELALLANKVNYTSYEIDYPDPPEVNYKAINETITKLFPSLGFYNIALDISSNIAQSSLVLGYAIEDIAHDLTEIIWRYENTSEDDALFHFEFLFRIHWGRHSRSLQLYLHDLSF